MHWGYDRKILFFHILFCKTVSTFDVCSFVVVQFSLDNLLDLSHTDWTDNNCVVYDPSNITSCYPLRIKSIVTDKFLKYQDYCSEAKDTHLTPQQAK